MPSSVMHSGQSAAADLQELAAQAPPELIVAIARLLQSGAIQVPDLQIKASAPQENCDMEREDGELEESEVEIINTRSAAVRTDANGPRNATILDHTRAHAPAHGKRYTSVSRPDLDRTVDQGAASKTFIQVLHNHGVSFQSVAKEVGDTPALRRLYAQIGLSVPSQEVVSQNVPNGINQTVARPSIPPPPTVPANAPTNRMEYLAKLAAAKNKKPEARSVVGALLKPAEAEKPKLQASQSNMALPKAEAKPLKTPSMTKTELARQRLEALKAEQAAKGKKLSEVRTSASSSITTSTLKAPQAQKTGSVAYSELGAGLVEMSQTSSQAFDKSRVPPSQLPAPFSSTPPSGQGGLPGLFMTPSFPGGQEAPLPKGESANLTASRKRAVAADFETASTNDTGSFKRPFGQSPYNEADQRMIIELSEDDDDDEDEDMYGTSSASQHKSFRQATALHDLSSRAFLKPQGSIPGTPSTGSSNTANYEKKIAEIEVFKRKIAERTAALKKEKSSANSTPGKGTPIATPVQSITVPPVLPPAAVKSISMEESLQQQRQLLRQRLEALQQAKKSPDGGNAPMMSGALPSGDSTQSPSNAETSQNVTGPEDESSGDNVLTSSGEEGEVIESETDLKQNLPSSNLPLVINPANEQSTGADCDSEAEDMEIETSSEEETGDDEDDDEVDDEDDEMDISEDNEDSDESEDEGLTPHHETIKVERIPPKHEINNQAYCDTSGSDGATSYSSENSEDDDSEGEDAIPAARGQANGQATGVDEMSPVNSDVTNQAPELRSPVEEVPEQEQKPKSKTSFVPYESLLSKFKAYKYHPDYLNEVAGGFRSMTYDHKIDPMTPLCPYETNGGVCNDNQCNAQHFSSMGLNGAHDDAPSCQ
ncbi:Hypothetical protein R9X50_00784000 [Acrodontium crateriforme]|uniref:Putative zinc-finger domain-containing protein n=1 Tax=Acrodontium crateriforme TaxID=150365 RepID=A0AAQ3MCS6_9PEZI|nr:Hypothetical protein R9X50_00784000 [Acrodontium crateriforme]